MSDMETPEHHGYGDLVKTLLIEIRKQGEDQAPAKIHPLVWANLAFIAGLIFWCGVTWQRVNGIEETAKKIAVTDSLVTEVQNLKSSVEYLAKRLDSYIDRPASH